MAHKRLIIEMGMGIDQHGQEPTVAAARAVRNAIAHNALPGVWEVAGLSDPDAMIVEVQVAVPYPEQVREAEVLAVLPFGRKSLTVESGGMVVQGRAIASLNDKNDEMLIAVAAVTVLIEDWTVAQPIDSYSFESDRIYSALKCDRLYLKQPIYATSRYR